MNQLGLGMEKNIEKGLKLYNKAAELNDKPAFYMLAANYLTGLEGVIPSSCSKAGKKKKKIYKKKNFTQKKKNSEIF